MCFRKQFRLFFLLTAVSLTLIAGCRSKGREDKVGLATFEQTSSGIQFEYPADWDQQELAREIILASSATALEENDFHGAGAMVIFKEEQSVVGNDLDYYIRKDVVQDEMRYLTAIRPDKLEINGREASGIKFARPQNDLNAIIGVTIIQLEEQSGVIFIQYVLDATVEKELLPQITQIIESINIKSIP
jgi:hypothetical protein